MDQIFIDHVIGNLKCYNTHSKFRNFAKEWSECVRNTNVRNTLLHLCDCQILLEWRHYYPTILCDPWSSKSRFFLVYWLYFKSKFFSIIYAQATRMPPRDFPFWEESLQGQIKKKKKDSGGQQYCRDNSILNNNKIIHMCSTQNCK